ncbi:retrotransposon protein, putative, ty1-copia subclass [Tanacetum coccineum]
MTNQEAGGSGSGIKMMRTYIPRKREEAEQRLLDDYFGDDETPPNYLEENFKRRYRMSSTLFAQIVNVITGYDDQPIPEYFHFFRKGHDATSRGSISAILKCTSAIRQLAYGTTPDAFDDSCGSKIEDLACIFWGSRGNNDLNVLYGSPLFDDVLADTATKALFVVNERTYKKGYYLADGIYPTWSSFVKTFSIARDEKRLRFKRVQESARKDIKRAFGVLQALVGTAKLHTEAFAALADGFKESKRLLEHAQELLQTVQNYSMHDMGKTVNELHAMRKLHEQTQPKQAAPALHDLKFSGVLAIHVSFNMRTLNTFLNRSWIYDTGCELGVKETLKQSSGKGPKNLLGTNLTHYDVCGPFKDHDHLHRKQDILALLATEVLQWSAISNSFDAPASKSTVSQSPFVVSHDYKFWEMDVKTAFLNGYLSEEVYMEQPEGKAVYILGIKIYKDRSRRLIGLCQSAYIEKILKRYHMENSKRGSIPMQEKLRLSKSQGASTPAELKRMQNVPYALVVGYIMYVVRCTRPDVAFAQNITSRFQQNPGDLYWATLRVSCYTNAGYLMDADDLKSQTGYVFVLNGGVVDWKSAKQSIFATLSIEAEYIAAFDASKEVVWVRKFIYGLGVVPTIEKPISMYCDNTRAIAIANESGITKGARHFRAKVHYLREVIKFGEIKLEKVHTDDNLADPFTKALDFTKHLEHTRNIGMLLASSLM